jgi:hypothetical protein
MNIALIIGVIAGIIMLKYAMGFLFKIIGILLIIGVIGVFCYQKGFWPFDKNLASVSTLEEKYCNGDKDKANKCDCIVKIIKSDINKRFTKDELKTLDSNRIKSAYLIKRSLDFCEPQIIKCLESKGAANDLASFKLELMKMDNFGIEELGDWFNDKRSKLEDAFDGVGNEKDDIDGRFDN